MKTTKKTIFEVDYNELDESINSFLKSKGYTGRDFEVISEEELSNYIQKSFDVGKTSSIRLKLWLTK